MCQCDPVIICVVSVSPWWHLYREGWRHQDQDVRGLREGGGRFIEEYERLRECCKLVKGPFTYKKRKVKGGRVTFTCNGYQKLRHYLSVGSWVAQGDNYPENDIYTLDVDTLPAVSDHVCVLTGIEDFVRQFRIDLESSVRKEPLQPFQTLYQTLRRKFTSELSYDLKILFLAQIPSNDSIQTSLYLIRREFVPPEPSTQSNLYVNLGHNGLGPIMPISLKGTDPVIITFTLIFLVPLILSRIMRQMDPCPPYEKKILTYLKKEHFSSSKLTRLDHFYVNLKFRIKNRWKAKHSSGKNYDF